MRTLLLVLLFFSVCLGCGCPNDSGRTYCINIDYSLSSENPCSIITQPPIYGQIPTFKATQQGINCVLNYITSNTPITWPSNGINIYINDQVNLDNSGNLVLGTIGLI